MKILIAGGGIAGTTLAFWLSKLGHNITIIERHPSLRAGGLQIDIRGHGIDVLKRMGLEDAFRSKAVEETGTQFVDSSGRRRAWFPANGAQSFTTEYEIMRGDLVNIFYDATKDRVKYLFGTSIQSFEDADNFLKVRFADGKMDQFDLLVGADGQNSRTRKMMVGSVTADGFHPLKDVVAYYSIPYPTEEGAENMATIYAGTEYRSMMVRSTPHKLLVYIGCKHDNERMSKVRRGDVEAEKQAFRDIYRGGGWKTEEIVDALKDSNDFYCEHLGVVKLESWSKGRVVLVGDAAYCSSPNTGMGTTSGILGAYILAGEIGRHCGRGDAVAAGVEGYSMPKLTAALTAYENAFRPFMDHIQDGVLEDKSWGLPSSGLGIFFMHLILGAASALRIDILGMMTIKESPKGWKPAEYEHLFDQ